jgi:hypothetical protein
MIVKYCVCVRNFNRREHITDFSVQIPVSYLGIIRTKCPDKGIPKYKLEVLLPIISSLYLGEFAVSDYEYFQEIAQILNSLYRNNH